MKGIIKYDDSKIQSLWGHWWDPDLKDMRDQAREWAKAQGYYDRHSGKAA